MKHPADVDLRARLERYAVLLFERAVPAGLVGRGDAEDLWARHIEDSLRGTRVIGAGDRVVDLGSGAGLPGVPLAIACPSATFVLAEERRSRAAFLEFVADDLELRNVSIHPGPVATLVGSFDLAVARAFSSLAGTWAAAAPLVGAGRVVYWAGSSISFDDVPDGVKATVFPEARLANQGPLVIMTRQ